VARRPEADRGPDRRRAAEAEPDVHFRRH
jgi:hypothetical protein